MKPIIGISIGDVNGIGPEVVLKSIVQERLEISSTPLIYSPLHVIDFYKNLFDLSINCNIIEYEEDIVEGKINVITINNECTITPGKPTPNSGELAIKSFYSATDSLLNNKIDALVTAPISKENTKNTLFNYIGHTEYLSQIAHSGKDLMMMVAGRLRVGLVSVHESLVNSINHLTEDKIISRATTFINSLRNDFGIKHPRLAILSLNPHAGENGLMGKEEIEIIQPAIDYLKRKNNNVEGAFPSDGFFGAKSHQDYDGILAMYHDQGLTPFKTLSFDNGVNYTAGLPFIRTSPDHGTAFNIAGKNIANPCSFINSYNLAIELVTNRLKFNTHS